MTNVVEFKPKAPEALADDAHLPDDATLACPQCLTGLWQLRHDGGAECENGHLFDSLNWEMK